MSGRNPASLARLAGTVLLIACVLTPVPGWGRIAPLPLPLPPEPPPSMGQPGTPVVRPSGKTAPEKPPGAPTTPGQTPPPATQEANKGSVTGLPIPRFVALRTDDVNMRKGPGFRYPIEWVYKRRELPVEILREFEVWRLVETPDGARGWLHEATLVGHRTFVVQGNDATLRADPRDEASPVALLKIGVIGRLRSCQAGSAWCRVRVGDYDGYLKRTQFWGTLPDEVVVP
jgi:SH3-like domain-containing protein